MNASVDVRAVLGKTAAGLWSVANSCSRSDLATDMRARAEEFDKARAAVAALIEANQAYDLALAALENFYRTISERGYLAAQIFNARELTEAFVRADDRRCKALLAVTPQAADA